MCGVPETQSALVRNPDRRAVVLGFTALATVSFGLGILPLTGRGQLPPSLPKEVAGIRLPDTALALSAADLARAACPLFLFHHCMRTFVFAGLLAERDHVAYDPELVFIAATLHDLGLTRRYASAEHSFEMDGADAAKEFLTSKGVSEARAELVWNAIAMHTSMLVEHQAPQVGLVGSGAGADVFGTDISSLAQDRVQRVVEAFPRLSFNTAFRDMLVDHCHRKPYAQRGTWLDAFCRVHNPGVQYGDLENRILNTRIPTALRVPDAVIPVAAQSRSPTTILRSESR